MEELEKVLEGILLTAEERMLIEWISGWDRPTVERLVGIIKKYRVTSMKEKTS